MGKDLEEIAADFAGGLIDALDGKAWSVRQVGGNQVLLDFAGSVEFGSGAGLLLADAGKAEEHDDADGEQEEEIDGIERERGEAADADGVSEPGQMGPSEVRGRNAEVNDGQGEYGKKCGQNEPGGLAVATAVPDEEENE